MCNRWRKEEECRCSISNSHIMDSIKAGEEEALPVADSRRSSRDRCIMDNEEKIERRS